MTDSLVNQNDVITMAHGAGGGASAALINDLFLKAFGDQPLNKKEDQARIALGEFTHKGDRLAFTTDSFVISPLFFPGGDIGKLAVCGTINDLAVGGAKPLYLSAAFILEEGLLISELTEVVNSMAFAAKESDVRIVTGDTKVVARGQADKMYINTSGIGVIPAESTLNANNVQQNDVILVNGFIGDHSAAVMMARQDMGISGELKSDCAALHSLISSVLKTCPSVKCIRDATRGGIAAILNEISKASNATIEILESSLPIRKETNAVCELLGIEPYFLANEGLAAFVVPESDAAKCLSAMQSHPLGRAAKAIAKVINTSESLLYIKTEYGSKRIVEVPYGIQLPRIC